ncbi:MAG: hypothetical protein IJY94_06070 [Clostridia bacterium]|nr:hypothetical protein [Clostridia bacterium]
MEVKVKQRDASVCNLKLMLLYLVILSHLIRPCINGSRTAYGIYHFIYSFHMPAFSFISGIYMKNASSCIKGARSSLIRYVIANICFTSVYLGKIDLITPYWHICYLLALSFWCLIGAGYNYLSSFLKGKRILSASLLVITFTVGITVGLVNGIDRTLSLSRSIVFLPYFLIGIMMPKNLKEQGRIKRGGAFLASGLALYFILKNAIPVFFMYHATPFGKLGIKGVILRVLCYAIGVLITLGIYYLSPNKRLPITKIGADTLMVYILHGPIVEWLRGYSENSLYVPLSFVMSAVMIYLLHRIFIFSGKLYAVRERKGGRIRDGTVL